jgi:cation transport ATPase
MKFSYFKDIEVKCSKYETCLGRIESTNLHYSDHEGVSAEFQIRSAHHHQQQQQHAASPTTRPSHDDAEVYAETKEILNRHMSECKRSQCVFIVLMFVSLFGLLLGNQFLHVYLSLLKNALLSVFSFYAFVHILFVKQIELRALGAGLKRINFKLETFSKLKIK